MFVFERRDGALTAVAAMEPEEGGPSGAVCSRCRTRLSEGELFGVGDGRVVCAECVDDEWAQFTSEEKLIILGFEVRD